MAKTATSEHAHEDRNALRIRIRKISGQLRSIEAMLEKGDECPDILNQVISARRGLKSFAEKLIKEHTEHCIREAKSEQSQTELDKLLIVLERYVE